MKKSLHTPQWKGGQRRRVLLILADDCQNRMRHSVARTRNVFSAPLGDMNGDGIVNPGDLLFLQRQILEFE